jgi:group I intron endonuclease
MYYVYCYKNLTNGKVYIGKTNNISKRKSRHRRNAFVDKLTLPFYNALRKYSEDGFEFTILDRFEWEDVVFDLEKFWIKAFESNNRKYGYNITIGGEGSTGVKHNENQRRINASRTGSQNPNAKLDDVLAMLIYNEYKSGIQIKDLSTKHGISVITIERLLSGKSWKHLKLDIAALSEIKKENMRKGRSLRWQS